MAIAETMPKCPKGYPAEWACIGEKCDHHAFYCRESNCCEKAPKLKCKTIKVEELIKIHHNSSQRRQLIFKNTLDFFENLKKVVDAELKNYKEWTEKLLAIDRVFASSQGEAISAEELARVKAEMEEFNDEYLENITAYEVLWQKNFREQFSEMRSILCERTHIKVPTYGRSSTKLPPEQMNKNIFPLTRIIWKESEKQYLFDILKFLKNVQSVNLLFHGGSHSFSVARFHELCDGIPNTLVVIRNEKEKVYGGFSANPWGSTKYERCIADESLRTFTFSISNKKRYLLRPQESHNAIEWNRLFGPLFGRCSMVQVWENANKVTKNWSNLPQCFKPTHGEWTNEMYEEMLGVKRYEEYRLLDWEVFQVVFY